MRRTAETAWKLAIAIAAIPHMPAVAQSTPAQKLEFEVATVRQNKAEPDAPRAPGDARVALWLAGRSR